MTDFLASNVSQLPSPNPSLLQKILQQLQQLLASLVLHCNPKHNLTNSIAQLYPSIQLSLFSWSDLCTLQNIIGDKIVNATQSPSETSNDVDYSLQ